MPLLALSQQESVIQQLASIRQPINLSANAPPYQPPSKEKM